MNKYKINIYGESIVEDEDNDVFNPFRCVISCIWISVKKILFLLLFLTIIVLAGIGATSLWYQPTRELLMQLLQSQI